MSSSTSLTVEVDNDGEADVTQPIVRLEKIDHDFESGVAALRNVNLGLQAGTFTALIGPSGAGKSTLLRIIADLLQPTSGRVWRQPQAERIGLVFQNHNLMAWRTVSQNIGLPLELRDSTTAERQALVTDLVKLVGLEGFEESYPAQLSGGMAQRVALARALAAQPKLLLLDEPFGSLDALTRERLGAELLRIRQARPITIFMVTHSIDEAVLLAEDVLVLSRRPGTIVHRMRVDLPQPRRLEMRFEPAFQRQVAAIRAHIDV